MGGKTLEDAMYEQQAEMQNLRDELDLYRAALEESGLYIHYTMMHIANPPDYFIELFLSCAKEKLTSNRGKS